MKGVVFDIDHNCINEVSPVEEYGDWFNENINKLNQIIYSDKFPDVVTPLNIKPGELLFAVWLEYSQGDSFGWSNCGSTEAIGVFREESSANEIALFIEETKELELMCIRDEQKLKDYISTLSNKNHITYMKDKESRYFKLCFQTSDKQKFYYTSFPWCGYFEELDNVYIDQLILI